MKAGSRYRFRFINITANNAGLRVSLASGATRARWRPLAKDGDNLPEAQSAEREAVQVVSVGETYDFLFEAQAPGELRLEVLQPVNGTLVVTRVVVE